MCKLWFALNSRVWKCGDSGARRRRMIERKKRRDGCAKWTKEERYFKRIDKDMSSKKKIEIVFKQAQSGVEKKINLLLKTRSS
jgi:hypothetical protein